MTLVAMLKAWLSWMFGLSVAQFPAMRGKKLPIVREARVDILGLRKEVARAMREFAPIPILRLRHAETTDLIHKT